MMRMPTAEVVKKPPSDAAKATDTVMSNLEAVCRGRDLGQLAERMGALAALTRWDMAEVETGLKDVDRGERVVQQAAHLLLDLGGKRLRPLCVALASRLGNGFGAEARECAIAVELVHCATLLHDDVVDDSDTRRGAAAARTVFGNAASIFAGDWLLVESLRRVRNTGVPGALERLLDIVDEMILAESRQLEARGRVDTDEATYFAIVEGKTAALFRWAMYAGARAGGLAPADADRLEAYGRHLGVAFQLIDDLLDYVGVASKTGKALFTDLREGKMTHPVLVARDRDPSVRELLEILRASEDDAATSALLRAMKSTGAIEETRTLAQWHAAQAIAQLDNFDEGPAKDALLTVARACVHRER